MLNSQQLVRSAAQNRPGPTAEPSRGRVPVFTLAFLHPMVKTDPKHGKLLGSNTGKNACFACVRLTCPVETRTIRANKGDFEPCLKKQTAQSGSKLELRRRRSGSSSMQRSCRAAASAI